MLAAQILALLEDGLWLRQCPRRQRGARRPGQGRAASGWSIRSRPTRCSSRDRRGSGALREQGFDFYDWGPGEIRLVTSWDPMGEALDQLAAAIARSLGPAA